MKRLTVLATTLLVSSSLLASPEVLNYPMETTTYTAIYTCPNGRDFIISNAIGIDEAHPNKSVDVITAVKDKYPDGEEHTVGVHLKGEPDEVSHLVTCFDGACV